LSSVPFSVAGVDTLSVKGLAMLAGGAGGVGAAGGGAGAGAAAAEASSPPPPPASAAAAMLQNSAKATRPQAPRRRLGVSEVRTSFMADVSVDEVRRAGGAGSGRGLLHIR
jgi:hypothetical protein